MTVTSLEVSTSTRYRVARWISILGYPYVALCSLPLSAGLAGGGAALAAAIGWSRIAMGRHTPAEVASGLVLGVAVGTALLVWR